MTREEFETLVSEALDSLPENFSKALSNVALVVEDWPSQEDLESVKAPIGSSLFGLYKGVPQTQRGNYSGVLPDKIVIYAGPLLRFFPDPEAVKIQIRKTVLHEIGHHFGMNEEEIARAMG